MGASPSATQGVKEKAARAVKRIEQAKSDARVQAGLAELVKLSNVSALQLYQTDGLVRVVLEQATAGRTTTIVESAMTVLCNLSDEDKIQKFLLSTNSVVQVALDRARMDQPEEGVAFAALQLLLHLARNNAIPQHEHNKLIRVALPQVLHPKSTRILKAAIGVLGSLSANQATAEALAPTPNLISSLVAASRLDLSLCRRNAVFTLLFFAAWPSTRQHVDTQEVVAALVERVEAPNEEVDIASKAAMAVANIVGIDATRSKRLTSNAALLDAFQSALDEAVTWGTWPLALPGGAIRSSLLLDFNRRYYTMRGLPQLLIRALKLALSKSDAWACELLISALFLMGTPAVDGAKGDSDLRPVFTGGTLCPGLAEAVLACAQANVSDDSVCNALGTLMQLTAGPEELLTTVFYVEGLVEATLNCATTRSESKEVVGAALGLLENLAKIENHGVVMFNVPGLVETALNSAGNGASHDVIDSALGLLCNLAKPTGHPDMLFAMPNLVDTVLHQARFGGTDEIVFHALGVLCNMSASQDVATALFFTEFVMQALLDRVQNGKTDDIARAAAFALESTAAVQGLQQNLLQFPGLLKSMTSCVLNTRRASDIRESARVVLERVVLPAGLERRTALTRFAWGDYDPDRAQREREAWEALASVLTKFVDEISEPYAEMTGLLDCNSLREKAVDVVVNSSSNALVVAALTVLRYLAANLDNSARIFRDAPNLVDAAQRRLLEGASDAVVEAALHMLKNLARINDTARFLMFEAPGTVEVALVLAYESTNPSLAEASLYFFGNLSSCKDVNERILDVTKLGEVATKRAQSFDQPGVVEAAIYLLGALAGAESNKPKLWRVPELLQTLLFVFYWGNGHVSREVVFNAYQIAREVFARYRESGEEGAAGEILLRSTPCISVSHARALVNNAARIFVGDVSAHVAHDATVDNSRVLSWRYDVDENGASKNLALAVVLVSQSPDIKYLFVDYFAVKNSDPESKIGMVVSFSRLYSALGTVFVYSKEEDAARLWLFNEVLYPREKVLLKRDYYLPEVKGTEQGMKLEVRRVTFEEMDRTPVGSQLFAMLNRSGGNGKLIISTVDSTSPYANDPINVVSRRTGGLDLLFARYVYYCLDHGQVQASCPLDLFIVINNHNEHLARGLVKSLGTGDDFYELVGLINAKKCSCEVSRYVTRVALHNLLLLLRAGGVGVSPHDVFRFKEGREERVRLGMEASGPQVRLKVSRFRKTGEVGKGASTYAADRYSRLCWRVVDEGEAAVGEDCFFAPETTVGLGASIPELLGRYCSCEGEMVRRAWKKYDDSFRVSLDMAMQLRDLPPLGGFWGVW